MYSAKITRDHRTAFIILCDHSGSMAEEIIWGGETLTKAEAEAFIINMMLEELINRCRRENGVRDYFDIAVLGYSGEGVKSLLTEKGGFVSVEQLVKSPVTIRRRHLVRTLPGGRRVDSVVDYRWWIEAGAAGNTPMGKALLCAEELSKEWCTRRCNRDSFPPIVINITDGEATDVPENKLLETASRIKGVSTRDGNTLLFNIHLAGNENGGRMSLPGRDDEIPVVPYARLLYEMSSPLPECYDRLVIATRPGACPPFRAVSYNCPMEELYGMLSIGTASSYFTL